MPKSWFRDWFNSPYYHQLYFNRDDNEAAAFIDQLISYLKPPPGSRMLDVACGKGRHSIQLAEKGYDVTGIDLSEESIDEALQSATEYLHFFQHDMRLPFRADYFDYAFNFFTSFGYFNTRQEHDDAIHTIAHALKKDGIFVLDYLNVLHAEELIVHQSEKQVDDVNFVITKWFDEGHFYKKVIVEDETMEEPLVYTEKVAKFSLEDFKEMFSHQGMQVQEVFGDYNFDNYDIRKSPRMIMVARKTIR